MKYLKRLVLFCAIVALQSCSGDVEPEPVIPEIPEIPVIPEIPDIPEPGTFLTLSVASDHYYVDALWAFVTDSQGKVIVSQKLQAGLNELHGEAPDIINLTLLQYYLGQNYTFDTFPNVDVNSTVTLSRERANWYTAPGNTGAVWVDITNFKAANFERPKVTVSDEFDYNEHNPASPLDPTSPGSAFLYIHKPSSDILVSGFSEDNSHPVYGWINGVTDGAKPSVDFANLKPFEQTITLPQGSNVSGHVTGYKKIGDDIQHRMFSAISLEGISNSTPPSKLGYLEGYDEYETGVQSTTRLPSGMIRRMTYSKIGSINPIVTMPDYDMTIVDPSLLSFDYTYTGNSTLQVHGFGYFASRQTFISWTFHTDGSGIPIVTELPADIKAQFPVLDISRMYLLRSRFYHFPDEYSYEQYFRDFQTGLTGPFLSHPEYLQVEFQ